MPDAGCRRRGGPALSEPQYKWRRVEGFTLVEILAALTIFLVVVSASYALFESGRALAAHGEYEAKRHQAVRAALRALEADLRGAFGGSTAYNTGFLGRSGGSADLPADSLDFVAYNLQPKIAAATSTMTTATVKECDMSRVTWSIDEDPTTKASGLVRKRVRLISEIVTVKDPEEGLEEISADVAALRFRYYDGSAWQDSWDSATSGAMPKAVEATIWVKGIWRGKEETVPFSTKYFLPVAAATPKKAP